MEIQYTNQLEKKDISVKLIWFNASHSLVTEINHTLMDHPQQCQIPNFDRLHLADQFYQNDITSHDATFKSAPVQS